MTYEFLKTGVEERVGWIEYRRPPFNAIDWKMLGEIPAALEAFLGDSGVRVVVFASALEKYFSDRSGSPGPAGDGAGGHAEMGRDLPLDCPPAA